MRVITTLLCYLIALTSFAQIQVITSAGRGNTSSPFQLIDSVSVTGIKTAATKDPKQIIARTDEVVTLSSSSFLNETTATGIVNYSWTITDASDGSIDLTGSGSSLNASALPAGEYHVSITASSLNSLPERQYTYGLMIEPPNYSEGEADFVIDMAQVQADTFVPSGISNLTYDGGTNATFDFGEEVRPGFKIAIKNNFTGAVIHWIGLIGTEANPVRIQNVGDVVTFTETSTQVLWQFETRCQFVTIDGRGTADEYGFEFMGKTTSGDQSQMIYFIGNFIKDIKIFGVYFDQTRDVYGFSDGGATLQFAGTQSDGSVSSSCNGNIGDAGYFTPGKFKVFSCRFLNARDEPIYLGHFEDAPITGIYRAYRVGEILIVYNYIENSGRDLIQFSMVTGGVVACNYGKNNALEENANHTSAISFNDGDTGIVYVLRNYFEDVEIFSSQQNGETGDGSSYFAFNVVFQKQTVPTNPNQFFFYNVEQQNFNNFQLNNSIKCADVNIAPWAIQYETSPTDFDLTYTCRGNVMSTGGSDQATWLELRTVNTASTDRSGWVISNTFRRTAQESQLSITSSNLRPNSAASILFGAGFDLTSYNLPCGNADIDGYSGLVDGGYTAGAYSGFKLFL